jgi:hypothetical protein
LSHHDQGLPPKKKQKKQSKNIRTLLLQIFLKGKKNSAAALQLQQQEATRRSLKCSKLAQRTPLGDQIPKAGSASAHNQAIKKKNTNPAVCKGSCIPILSGPTGFGR